MIAAAEQQQKTAIVVELKSHLKLYEDRQTCRPVGEVTDQAKPN
jgi:hypothetical protein